MKPDDLAHALNELGLRNRNVVVHSSLKSFGNFEGGASSVVTVLKQNLSHILMPAFSTRSIVRPPQYDRPARNGCDYDDPNYWKMNSDQSFDLNSQIVDDRMGRIAGEFAISAGVLRSPHPWHSWAAYGKDAAALVGSHPWGSAHQPLRHLIEIGANVLFIGVDLTSCTAIHLAEELAGRKSFIRWSRDSKGMVRRVAVAGCAAGFGKFMPHCGDLFKQTNVGPSRLMTAPLGELVQRAVQLITSDPEITRCSPDCLRCSDAILGGPQE